MYEFEDILLPGTPIHVPTEVPYPDEYEEIDDQNHLIQIMKELVDKDLNKEITFKPMVGGVTNTCKLYGKGSENFIDRKTESTIQYLLSKNGVGPRFYGTFKNGCIYGYVEGDQLQLEDLADDHILSLIGNQVSQWHSLDLQQRLSREPSLFVYMNSWMANAQSLVVDYTQIGNIDLEYYRKEAEALMDFLSNQYSDTNKHIRFCHNDLIPRNMIHNKEKDEIKFIDFEYSGYNYRGYDLGNFFCEFSGLDLDYTKYPSVQVQKQFIKYYLEGMKQQESDTSKISEKEIHDLYVEANHFTLGSHLMWGFWGVVQHFNSTIDFDYLDYAKKRFKQYDLVKKKVLALK
eukprot:gene7488-9202_t